MSGPLFRLGEFEIGSWRCDPLDELGKRPIASGERGRAGGQHFGSERDSWGVHRMRALISGSQPIFIPASMHQPRLQRTAWLVVLAAAFNLALLVTAAAVLIASAVALFAGCEPRTDSPAEHSGPRDEATSSPVSTLGSPDRTPQSAVSAAATAGLAAEDELATTQVCSIAGVLDVRKVDDDSFELSRGNLKAAVDAVQQKTSPKARNVNLSPITSTSGRRGLRVGEVGSRAACGVAPGDILLSIDSIAVTDTERLGAHRNALLASDSVKLEVERAGQTKVLVYSIKD